MAEPDLPAPPVSVRVDVMHSDPIASRLTPAHRDQVIDPRARDGRCDGG
jgi:hypothetical protein